MSSKTNSTAVTDTEEETVYENVAEPNSQLDAIPEYEYVSANDVISMATEYSFGEFYGRIWNGHKISIIHNSKRLPDFQTQKLFCRFDYNYNLANLYPNISSSLTMDCFSNIKFFCDGSHCRIFQAVYSDELVILKALSDSSLCSHVARRDFEMEISILSRLRHPNIVAIKGYGYMGSGPPWRPLIALESLNGDTLAYHLSQERPENMPPFSRLRYIRMARELASALDYIHDRLHPDCALIHRDLKPDNIGFTAEGVLKIFDFGLCVAVRRSASVSGSYCLTGCTGSFRYMAPENALNRPYNEKVDIYSYGLIVYEMITGVAPYRNWTKEDLYERALRGSERPGLYTDDSGREVVMRDSERELLSRCWDPRPELRPAAREAVVFFAQYEDHLLRPPLSPSASTAACNAGTYFVRKHFPLSVFQKRSPS